MKVAAVYIEDSTSVAECQNIGIVPIVSPNNQDTPNGNSLLIILCVIHIQETNIINDGILKLRLELVKNELVSQIGKSLNWGGGEPAPPFKITMVRVIRNIKPEKINTL